jgi:N-acetylmuramoyl-L-alanine amidase
MNALIIWDAGHKMHTAGKRTPPFKDGKQIREYEFNRPTVDKGMAMAKSYGFEVFDTSPEEKEPGLNVRVKRANNAARIFLNENPDGVIFFVSVHYNAHKSEWDASTANGIEVFHNPGSIKGKPLAEAVLAELAKGTPMTDRGVKSVGFYVLKYTTMPAILCECGFMDHKEDAILMKDPEYQEECAREIIDGIRKNLGVYEKKEVTPIIGKATATVKQAIEWARGYNAPQEFLDLAALYWKIWGGLNLNPAVGYAQFAHETGFLYRDGKSMAGIDASYHNPCGLKTTMGGGDTQASAHTKFKDWTTGITAHADHAALYAGAPGYPKQGTPDPRHFTWIRGKAPTLEELGGRWAPNPNYGINIRDKFLKHLERTEVPEEKCECEFLKRKITKLEAENETLKNNIDLIYKNIEGLLNKLKE